MAWYCESKPALGEDHEGEPITIWTLKWHKPLPEQVNGLVLPDETLTITNEGKTTTLSFEMACQHFEKMISDPEMDLLCQCRAALPPLEKVTSHGNSTRLSVRWPWCCAQTMQDSPCHACRFAMGFHHCQNERSMRRGFLQWPAGCLHNLKTDGQRVLWNLHRRHLPLEVLEKKIDGYIANGLIDQGQAEAMFACIKAERGEGAVVNDLAGEGAEDPDTVGQRGSRKLTPAQMEALLEKRVQQMKEGRADGSDTDQYRVFKFIVEGLQSDKPLRLMVQASPIAPGLMTTKFAPACGLWGRTRLFASTVRRTMVGWDR